MTRLLRLAAIGSICLLAAACILDAQPTGDSQASEANAEIPMQCPPVPCPPEMEAAMLLGLAAQAPEVSILYHLVDLYEPVKFSHKAHTQFAEDCATCHHHGSDVEQTPACRECHGLPFKALSKPGLKGAYHRQCMNCHRQMGAGPLACEACHAVRKRLSGESPTLTKQNAPVRAKLGHLSEEYEPVDFSHQLHTELTDSCADCHHHHGDVEVAPPCRECHNVRRGQEPGKPLGLYEAYHNQCLNCHRGKGSGPLGCEDCHKKKVSLSGTNGKKTEG